MAQFNTLGINTYKYVYMIPSFEIKLYKSFSLFFCTQVRIAHSVRKERQWEWNRVVAWSSESNSKYCNK